MVHEGFARLQILLLPGPTPRPVADQGPAWAVPTRYNARRQTRTLRGHVRSRLLAVPASRWRGRPSYGRYEGSSKSVHCPPLQRAGRFLADDPELVAHLIWKRGDGLDDSGARRVRGLVPTRPTGAMEIPAHALIVTSRRRTTARGRWRSPVPGCAGGRGHPARGGCRWPPSSPGLTACGLPARGHSGDTRACSPTDPSAVAQHGQPAGHLARVCAGSLTSSTRPRSAA